MIAFPYYSANIHASNPLGMVSLDQFINAIRSPKPHIIHTIEQIKQASLENNESLRAELKQSLYSFTPAAVIKNTRSYNNITRFTGLLVLDFDKLDPKWALSFKYYLFNAYDFIYACWLSPSSKGVKALVSIPVVQSVDEFKSYHKALQVGIMDHYIGYDNTTQNPVLPLFLSHDPDILSREEPSLWDQKYSPPIQRTPIPPFKLTPDIDRVTKIITSHIHAITDNGHPQLRAATYLLGGYIGSGYIDYDSAVRLINHLIESNHYLSQPKKIAGYKKTALTMLQSGTNKPTYFN